MKNLKAGISGLVVVVGSLYMGSLNPSVTYAAQNINVTVDGRVLNFDQPPVIVNDRTLVPLRAIFESLGVQISWDNATQTVTATKDNTTIIIKVGSQTATKNGQTINLDVPAQVINDRTLVPVRFVSEALGEHVNWDDSSNTVIITSNQNPQNNDQLTVQQIGKQSDRVVFIEVDDPGGQPIGTGSGFVVGSDGEILTNYHVIKGASSAKITFSNKSTYSTTTVLLNDSANDLALLKIDATNLPTVTLGDSSAITLGDSIVAIGSPLGYQNSLTTGVISSTARDMDGRTFIQISAPVDHGSSGGALYNMKGEVIGVTSNRLADSAAELNLAIPSNTVKAFLQRPHNSSSMSSLITSVVVSGSSILGVGSQERLTVTTQDSNGNPINIGPVTWSIISNNHGNAFIDANGNFIASAAGTYQVTATINGVVSDPFTITVISASSIENIKGAQDYLTQYWSTASYNDISFHPHWNVLPDSSTPNALNIGCIIDNENEIAAVLSEQNSNDALLPSFMLRITEEVHKRFGGDNFLGVYMVKKTNIDPTGTFPANEIKKDSSGQYIIFHPISIAENNYTTGTFTYTVLPEDGGKEVVLKMN